MQSIKTTHTGSLTVQGPMLVSGIVTGDITVEADAELTLSGICSGNLVVKPGGAAYVAGIVNGSVLNNGAVDIRGVVQGQVLNAAGSRFERTPNAVINGSVRSV